MGNRGVVSFFLYLTSSFLFLLFFLSLLSWVFSSLFTTMARRREAGHQHFEYRHYLGADCVNMWAFHSVVRAEICISTWVTGPGSQTTLQSQVLEEVLIKLQWSKTMPCQASKLVISFILSISAYWNLLYAGPRASTRHIIEGKTDSCLSSLNLEPCVHGKR